MKLRDQAISKLFFKFQLAFAFDADFNEIAEVEV